MTVSSREGEFISFYLALLVYAGKLLIVFFMFLADSFELTEILLSLYDCPILSSFS